MTSSVITKPLLLVNRRFNVILAMLVPIMKKAVSRKNWEGQANHNKLTKWPDNLDMAARKTVLCHKGKSKFIRWYRRTASTTQHKEGH